MISWMPLLAGRLSSATDGGVFMREIATVDPLKIEIETRFRDPIPGRDAWIAFQIISHAFAAANDAAIQKIKKVSDNLYIIEVLIKNRHKSSMFDPFVDKWKSNHQKRKEAYLKYLKDKKAELEKDLSNEQPEPTSKLPPDPDLWCR